MNHCPFCLDLNIVISKKDYFGFDLYSCKNCFSEFTLPFKSPLLDFYTEASDSASERRHQIASKLLSNHPSISSNLFKNGNGKKVLDIGCGNGDFCEFVVSREFEATGIDIDKNSLKVARSRKLANSSFEYLSIHDLDKFDANSFDIISMFEVIEHIDIPLDLLKKVRRILKPNGYFIGSLPNENRFLAKSYNMNYGRPPYHINFWTTSSWTNYLVNFQEFKLVQCEANMYYGYIVDISVLKLHNYLKINYKSVISKIMMICFIPFKWLEISIEKILKKSSSFYFEFQVIK